MRQLTSLDAQFLAVEDGRHLGHVSALSILDPSTAPGGRLTLKALRNLLAERLHLLEPFRWRLAPVPFGLDHPYWVEDPGFDLDFHIRELALPAPGDDHQLAEQVARLHSRALDRSHPLWELYLIHGLERGRVAVMTKIHHSAIDGVSGGELLGLLLDPSPEGRDVPPPTSASRREVVPGDLELLARTALDLPRQAARALLAIPRTLPYLDLVVTIRSVPGVSRLAALSARGLSRHRDGGVLERPDYHAPRTGLNGRISGHRRFAFTSLPLDDVKAIKDHFGVTVNDVVMALCTGALRRRLQARRDLPEVPLLAMIPVSVRTPAEAGTFGNRVSTMIVPLPTDEPDPALRLDRLHGATLAAKERHQATPATLLQDANMFVPPALLARASRVVGALATQDPLSPPVNVVISNVPGSRHPLYLAGARLEAQYPVSVVMDGVGVNFTVMSYRSNLDIGIVGDRELAPDVWELVADVRTEFAELRQLLPATTSPPKPKKEAAR